MLIKQLYSVSPVLVGMGKSRVAKFLHVKSHESERQDLVTGIEQRKLFWCTWTPVGLSPFS
jgi:hypothetical protein